jgi:protein O-mannosyl-transferase
LALGIVTASLYWPVHQNEFIILDDPDYLTTNPQVKAGITSETICWAFTQYYAGNWHPLTWISHMLDCQLFGLNPGMHHLVNAAFHVANSLMLFLLLQRLTRSHWRSAFVAALFALHPLHVESVAWAAERKDVLSTFFFMLTIGAYVRYAELRTKNSKFTSWTWIWYAVAFMLFALGLMSKSMLVTLPFVLLLLDFWPLGRLSTSGLKSQKISLLGLAFEKILFFALSAISCGLTFWAQSKGQAVGSVETFPVFDRITNSLMAYLGYIEKMFWPANLSVFYPFPAEPRIEGAALAMLLLAVITAFATLNAKSRPYLLVGWLWFLGTLVPVIGLVQVGSHAMADRYTYIPLIGLFIIVAWGAADVLAGWKYKKFTLIPAATLVLLACAILTSRQVAFWQSTKTLFSHAVQVDDQNYMAWTILGDLLRLEGKHEQASDYLNRAIQVRPNSEIPWYGLGLSLVALKKPQEAENAFQTALKRSPANPHILNDYATLLINLGRLDEAEAELQKARQANPYLTKTRLNQAMIFQKQGKLNDLVKQYEEILQLDPDNDLVRVNLAVIYSVLGRLDQAVTCYREFLRTNPTNNNARVSLGLALVKVHDPATAEVEFSTVLKVDPKNTRALDGLGSALAEKGSLDEAKARFAEAMQIDPKFPDAHMHYAMSLSVQNQPQQAILEYRKTLELDDQRTEALNNLAWMLASHPDPTIRNGKEAVELAERACRLTDNGQPFFLGTLAAAYAEAGRFNDAITTAGKARDLAKQLGWNGVAERNDYLLDLYRAGKAYHEPAAENPAK